jgi:hypothetical protein
VIWVGTDDGNLQLTRDGGKSWTLMSKKVPGLPPGTWVSTVEASRHDPAVAYATFDGHALGDMKTYVYRTADYGKTWTPLATAELQGYAHVVREDPVNPRLLYLGTEMGLFLTLDQGKRWARYTGIPPVAVRELAFQLRDGDLVIATHGRGIYIIDDLSPLRALTPEVLASDAALLPSRPAALGIPVSEQRFDGDQDFEGRSRSESAPIAYYLKKRHVIGDLRLEIYDDQGKLVSTLPGGKRRGINRVGWPMRLKAPKVPPATNLVPQAFSFLGPRVPAGAYTVKLIRGKETLEQKLTLVADPRGNHSAADRALQQETAHRLYAMAGTLTDLVDDIADARDQAQSRAAALPAGDALGKKLQALMGQLETLRGTLVATREGGRHTGEEQLREKLVYLYGSVNGYDGRPTNNQLDYVKVLDGELKAARARFVGITTKELVTVNGTLASRKLEPIKVRNGGE